MIIDTNQQRPVFTGYTAYRENPIPGTLPLISASAGGIQTSIDPGHQIWPAIVSGVSIYFITRVLERLLFNSNK